MAAQRELTGIGLRPVERAERVGDARDQREMAPGVPSMAVWAQPPGTAAFGNGGRGGSEGAPAH